MNPKQNDACDWGLNERDAADDIDCKSDSQQFIAFYRQYIEDKSSLECATNNEETFAPNAQKVLEEWFKNSGEDYDPKLEEVEPSKYLCTIEIPLDGDLFEVHSELYSKKADALADTCLKVCRLLDKAGLLYEWQDQDGDRSISAKRKLQHDSCHLDDDDSNLHDSLKSKRQKPSKRNIVHNYESLMSEWTKVNMEILKSKSQLVKIDLSVYGGSDKEAGSNRSGKEVSDEDEDPLDAFMKNVNKKTELTLNDKIEKTQLKLGLEDLEKQKEELQRLLEIAKPRFDMKKLISKPSSSQSATE